MPLPKPLTDIKKDLEALLVSDPSKTLKYIQELLPEGSEKRNQTILLEGRFNQANKAYQNGLIKFEDLQLILANVNAAILDLSTGLTEDDFDARVSASGKPAVSVVPKFVIIYDERDQNQCDLLSKHLNVLSKILKKIRVYKVYDAQGDELIQRATEEISDADYLLVLITANLFDSIWYDLVYKALGEGRRMIPIRIEKADFEGTGLEKFRSLPSMGKAVSDFSNADAAYADIVGELKKLLPK